MGTFKCRVFSVVPFYLFLLTLFTCNRSSASEDKCKTAFCGMGTCHETWAGFECDCKRGWSKIQLGPFSSPCVIPNCTFDSQCHVPLPFLPPAPPPQQFAHRSESNCFYYCGDGTCEEKSLLNVVCNCNEGAANLLNDPHFPCFPKCAISANCSDGIDLGFGSDPPPSPPPQQSGSPGSSGGSGEMPNSSRELHKLTTMVLATVFLNWI